MVKFLPSLMEKFACLFKKYFQEIKSQIRVRAVVTRRKAWYLSTILSLAGMLAISFNGLQKLEDMTSNLISPVVPLKPLSQGKSGKEVFGFAPFWTFNKLSNVDFSTLTTLAYFGVPVLGNGDLDQTDPGYQTFKSKDATNLFKKAHLAGTRVVLTLTQMQNEPIIELLDDQDAENHAVVQAVNEVQKRGIDGINVDFEYQGDPGDEYRRKFTNFIALLDNKMHQVNPNAEVSVSVYAASVKEPKIYDIHGLSQASDKIFMMGYDFAVAGSDNAIPTAPLYGYKSGKYWYDVSTAVEDFLTQMPADKLILGVPWYGYNYAVYNPSVKAATLPWWGGQASTQTYAVIADNVTPTADGVMNYQEGWDNDGEVGYRAYYDSYSGDWRMVFVEDTRSLGLKYDFAKSENLGGIGIWALGFDSGKSELWAQLRDEFGAKLADSLITDRPIYSDENN